jgi:bifunctional DNA primase/polymerase-like protein
VNADLDLTLAAVARHGWQVVLLGTRSKKPTGKTWTITSDVNVIRRHVEHGGNIGLVCGPESGVAVPDGDNLDQMRAMFAALGALAIWVETGSGTWHCYVGWEPNLPAKLMWQGRKVGELQRGGIGPDGQPVLQHVVLPPSVHPGDVEKGVPPGGIYRWRVDPCSPLPVLPDAWRAYFLDAATLSPESISTVWGLITPSATRPTSLPADDRAGVNVVERAPWDGPPAEELLRRALLLPGPSRQKTGERRRNGVKFACPACREVCPDCGKRHDKDGDNAFVRNDGKFGCAVNVEHRRAIAIALGVIAPDVPEAVMPGPEVKVTAADLDADWTGDF